MQNNVKMVTFNVSTLKKLNKYQCTEIWEGPKKTKTYQNDKLEHIQGQINKIRSLVEDRQLWAESKWNEWTEKHLESW